eukprot:scaffold127230_cov60-Phaeocystis_antarctica.AAC.2
MPGDAPSTPVLGCRLSVRVMVAPVTCAWHVHAHGMCMAWCAHGVVCAWRAHGVCMACAWCYSGACAPQLQSEVTPLVVRLEAEVLVRLTRRRQGAGRCKVQGAGCRAVQGGAGRCKVQGGAGRSAAAVVCMPARTRAVRGAARRS